MNRVAITAIAFATLSSAAGCVVVDDDNSFFIYNDSSYVLVETYIAEESDPSWGPNLLVDGPLFPGDELIITDLECGTYDVLVVDDTNVECELRGIDLCLGDDDGWVVDDFTLDVCAF